MTILFLIGNGFDLGLGLKTRFSDYFEQFCEEYSSSKLAKKIESYLNQTGKEQSNIDWSDFEIALGQFTELFTSKDQSEFFDELLMFEQGFIRHLNLQEQEIVYNPEIIVQTFQNAFCKLISTDILTVESYNQINKFFSNSTNHIVNFINFNYTHTLARYLDKITPKIEWNKNTWTIGKLVHVHGTSEKLPIVGVDRTSQIANKELAKDGSFVQKFVKPQINNRIQMHFADDAQALIDSSSIVCIYGMSLGATDATWWRSLAVWLNKTPSHHIIIFDCDSNYNGIYTTTWIDKQETVINKLMQFSGFEKNVVTKLSQRVYVVVQKNIFSMNLARKVENSSSDIDM